MLAGGLNRAPLLARMMMTALGGGIRSGSEPAPDLRGRTMNAMQGAGGQALLEGIFGKAADFLPRAGLKTGMKLGGIRGETEPAVDAFMRERGRSGPFGSIPLGRQSRHVPEPSAPAGPAGAAHRTVDAIKNRSNVQRRIDTTGKKLTAAEQASTATTPISSLIGATSSATRGAKSGVGPITSGLKFKTGENEALREIYAKTRLDRAGIPTESLTEDQLRHVSERVLPRVRARHLGGVDMNMEELGNLRRTTGRQAEPIIAARQRREPVDFDPTMEKPAVAEGFHSRAKELQDLLNPEVKPLNQRLSDLFTIRNVNDTLRGGGDVMSDVGQLSTRGGLAHGVAQSVGRYTQSPPGPFRNFLNMFGAAALAPSVISRAGYGAGTASMLTPTAARLFDPSSEADLPGLLQLLEDLQKKEDEKPSIMRGVQLRKP